MNLFSEIISAIQSDLNVDDNSPLFPLATVKSAANRSYIKCGALFKWPQLKDAKKTSTENGKEYYDYPETWRPDSIWKVEIDNVRYGEEPDGSPLTFEDYLAWREDYPSSTEKKWANQERRFFVYPVPTSDGDNNLSVWGYKNVDTLSSDSDTTIFSYNMPECNEAIVLEAVAILKNKGEEGKVGLDFYSTPAKQILIVAWDKIRKEQAKYEKIAPFFDVPDLFSGKSNLEEELGWND